MAVTRPATDAPEDPDDCTRSPAVTAQEWIAAFAAELAVPVPDAETTDGLLALAAAAAHQSERMAAPLACYLVGLAGVDPAWARRVAEAMADPEA
jgi:hypothetical protein